MKTFPCVIFVGTSLQKPLNLKKFEVDKSDYVSSFLYFLLIELFPQYVLRALKKFR